MTAQKWRAPVVEHPDQPAARKMVGDTILHDEAQADAIHAPSPTLVHYRVDDVLVRPHALILTTFRSVTTFLKVLSGYEPTTPLFTSSTQSTCNRSTAGGSDRNNNRSRAKRVRTRSKRCPLALPSCSRRARTETLRFLISLAICGQCLDVRTDYSANATTLGLVSDFARTRTSSFTH